jgi:hypothetical protein
MAAENTVRLQNKSGHLKSIALAGGAVITVPPTEEGSPGIEVRFDSAEERTGFDKALTTPAIKAWLEAGELVVVGGGSASPSEVRTGPGEPLAAGRPPTRRDKE